jgi:hypothetical protein
MRRASFTIPPAREPSPAQTTQRGAMRSRVAYLFVTVVATVLVTATAASGGAVDDLLKLSFYEPVYVSQGPAYQAAEPSIRVDETDPTQRIWITAPTGIGFDNRSLGCGATCENGDLFWYSDDDGKTWVVASAARRSSAAATAT